MSEWLMMASNFPLRYEEEKFTTEPLRPLRNQTQRREDAKKKKEQRRKKKKNNDKMCRIAYGGRINRIEKKQ